MIEYEAFNGDLKLIVKSGSFDGVENCSVKLSFSKTFQDPIGILFS